MIIAKEMSTEIIPAMEQVYWKLNQHLVQYPKIAKSFDIQRKYEHLV